jgi:hypothetical protein
MELQQKTENQSSILSELGIDDPVFKEAQEKFAQAQRIDDSRKDLLAGSMRKLSMTPDGRVLREELERQVVASVYHESDRTMVYMEGQRNAFRFILSLMSKGASNG